MCYLSISAKGSGCLSPFRFLDIQVSSSDGRTVVQNVVKRTDIIFSKFEVQVSVRLLEIALVVVEVVVVLLVIGILLAAVAITPNRKIGQFSC